MVWVAESKGRVRRRLGVFIDRADLWILPTVVVAAWFYFPYCQTGPNLCIWRALFHKDCPGCGLTRGICFLVHGRVREAIAFNRLSVITLLLMAANFFREAKIACREGLQAARR